jgi:signal transduction histidine kinase
MITGRHFSSAIRLPALFVILAVMPVATLGWLGWRLLEQDRALENQRSRERLEDTATLVSHEIDRSLARWEDLLVTAAEGVSVEVPAGAAVLLWDARGISRRHGLALPYYPAVPPPPKVREEMFAEAEALEVRVKDLAKAAASYRKLASTTDGQEHAFALMRLARCLRNDGRIKEALDVYAELQTMGDAALPTGPAALVALKERAALLTVTGDVEAAKRESASLAQALWEGRFVLDRETFEFYSDPASPAPLASDAIRMSEAVERLWPRWQQEPSGRAAWTSDGLALATVWRRTPSGTATIVGHVDTLMAPALAAVSNSNIHVSLENAEGAFAWGDTLADPATAVKTSRETGLPWTMRIALLDTEAIRNAALRRNLTIAGFGLLVLMIATASYFVFRSVHRELSVARLQSDFVAAVSHEFRTPLTAVRHLAELLEEGGADTDLLPEYYRALGKESRRLQGVVESLLDFGRMEAGRRTYQMDDINAGEFTRRVVDEFRDSAAFAGHQLDLQAPPEPLPIHADRDALTLALRNLLDNAIKYSPEPATVRISVERQNGLARIAVADRGAGIPKEEQRQIFRKFARGASARKLNVKGTGIGLTMADHIVRAHGGRIELASEPGEGSTFTMVLPVTA